MRNRRARCPPIHTRCTRTTHVYRGFCRPLLRGTPAGRSIGTTGPSTTEEPESMTRMIVAAVMAVLSTIVLLPVFVVAGLLLLFASCVHAIGRLLEPRYVSWQKLMAFDEKLGWKPRPNLDTH